MFVRSIDFYESDWILLLLTGILSLWILTYRPGGGGGGPADIVSETKRTYTRQKMKVVAWFAFVFCSNKSSQFRTQRRTIFRGWKLSLRLEILTSPRRLTAGNFATREVLFCSCKHTQSETGVANWIQLNTQYRNQSSLFITGLKPQLNPADIGRIDSSSFKVE